MDINIYLFGVVGLLYVITFIIIMNTAVKAKRELDGRKFKKSIELIAKLILFPIIFLFLFYLSYLALTI